MSNVKEQIYKAFNEDFDQFNYKEIDKNLQSFNDLKPFNVEEQMALNNYFEDWLVRFVYNSNSIEGSTLSLGDTALVCEGEFVPTDKNSKLKDIFAAKGICDGYKFMQNQIKEKSQLDKKLIQDIHEITTIDMDVAVRGIFKNYQNFIKGANTVPVPPEKVRESIDDLIYAYNTSKNHPILKAAAFHCMYERIHPFVDGNGRSGRTLMNFILESSGYPGITIKNDAKGQYNKALDDWAFKGENKHFIDLVSSSVKQEIKCKTDLITESRNNQKKTKEPTIADRAKAAAKSVSTNPKNHPSKDER